MASFVNISSFSAIYASEIPVSAFGQLPKVLLLLPQLSVRSGAVIKCDSWYCVSPSCPRILPAAPQPHPGYSLQWDAFSDEKVMNVFRKLLIRSP